MPQNLVSLALEGRIDDLEAAWEEALNNPGDVEQYRKTIQILCEQDMASRALALASLMVDALVEQDRTPEAIDLALTVVRLGAHNETLARRLCELYAQRFGAEPWYEHVKSLAGLDENQPTQQALERFDALRRYTGGYVLYHRAGWGEGLVQRFVPETNELVIDFGGQIRQVPFQTAIDSMQALDRDDLRSMLLLEREELERLAREEPSALIIKAARLYRGRITSTQVKQLLSPSVVPSKKWASFWKRAKAAAAVDPYLRVEGSATRPIFVLRNKPLSLAEEARRAVEQADHLGQQIAVCRDYLERCTDPQMRETILELAREHLKKSAEARPAHRLEGLLLLEEYGKNTGGSATEALRALVLAEDGEFRPEALAELASQAAREHAVALLEQALGDRWTDLCVSTLTRVPASVVELVVNRLEASGQAPRLLALWNDVAPYPRRHPVLTYLLGRLHADGHFADREGAPDPVTVGRVLLHLARVLSESRRGNPTAARLLTRLTSLLVGRRNLLGRVLEDISRDDLATFLGITERSGPDFPHEIVDRILRTVAARFPDLTATPEKPFWELDHIYVTEAGLARQREALAKLVNVDIPRNSAAIGAAASHGDLSENSEWDAALEEQRNLTSRAQAMEQELRKARLLEDQQIPDGVVAPGTRVTIQPLDGGVPRSMTLLGPWDEGEDVINYRAPMGQLLLGKKVGDTAALPSSQCEEQVRIVSIERVV